MPSLTGNLRVYDWVFVFGGCYGRIGGRLGNGGLCRSYRLFWYGEWKIKFREISLMLKFLRGLEKRTKVFLVLIVLILLGIIVKKQDDISFALGIWMMEDPVPQVEYSTICYPNTERCVTVISVDYAVMAYSSSEYKYYIVDGRQKPKLPLVGEFIEYNTHVLIEWIFLDKCLVYALQKEPITLGRLSNKYVVESKVVNNVEFIYQKERLGGRKP